MNAYTKIFATLAVCLAGGAFASERVGNGGYVVYCDDDSRPRVLDYFDGKFRFPSLGELDLGASDDVFDMVGHVFERLETIDPERSAKYLAEAESFLANTAFIPERYPLPNAEDIGPNMVPSGCRVAQVAANTVPTQLEEAKFWIKENIWLEMDAIGRAGLVIHEIVYDDALQRGHKDSSRARYITYLISSEGFAGLSVADYRARLVHNHMMEFSTIIDDHLFRYFDSLKLSYEEAEEFCQNLPGVSRLATTSLIRISYFDESLVRSAIGRNITGADGNGSELIWVRDAAFPQVMTFDRILGEEPHDPQQGAKHSFICHVDALTLPDR